MHISVNDVVERCCFLTKVSVTNVYRAKSKNKIKKIQTASARKRLWDCHEKFYWVVCMKSVLRKNNSVNIETKKLLSWLMKEKIILD